MMQVYLYVIRPQFSMAPAAKSGMAKRSAEDIRLHSLTHIHVPGNLPCVKTTSCSLSDGPRVSHMQLEERP